MNCTGMAHKIDFCKYNILIIYINMQEIKINEKLVSISVKYININKIQ